MLLHCNPSNPIDLWNLFKTNMPDNFMRHFDAKTTEAMVFYDIEAMLAEQGRSFSDFGIPIPSVFCPLQSKSINKEEELRFGQKMYETLNEAQCLEVAKILGAYHRRSATTASCFFIDGAGGTGKTYLYNTLCHLFRGQGVSVLTVAWTRIAANLLSEGRTVHSRFKLPVPLLETSTSSIRPNTKKADTIGKADVVIWDEAPMDPSYALKAADILLRDIMNISVPFGGKIMLGNGELPASENDEIDLPTGCISDGNLVGEIFGKHISLEDIPNLCDRMILCPQNEHSLIVNEQVLQRLPGIEKVYSSVNDIECDDGEDICNYPTEFLNSLTPSGMPPLKPNLKPGAIVMLRRNLDVNRGLCNGTRLIVRRLHNHTVDCEVATGSNKGNRTLIPRTSLIPSDTFLPFKLITQAPVPNSPIICYGYQ
ncbi:unnamed protein product [Rotaria magnacalcarata]|uniref:ATP-dependent DNA helicase n=1 Tax=Rotaria magnacalcarata TaxID=392030 RepID=A0A820B441_9BILA|nr:unnamed protein product [Rotaria magnacalcarata]